MKVFTFFYNRYDNATTSKALYENGINHNVLIHSSEDADKFLKFGTCKGAAIVTGNGKGLAYQRNSALDMMDTGEWAVFMSDDFRKIRSLPLDWITSSTNTLPINFSNQQQFRLKEKHVISLKEMFSLFPKLIELAETNGIHLIGFGLHDNPQNLKKKFSHRGLADGRFWLVKKSNYKFDTRAQSIDDYAWTAENLVRHRNVLILNWLVPFFDRYTAGGFGTAEDRKEFRKKECEHLVKKYSPLIKYANKLHWDAGTHLKLYASDKNIQILRKRIGLL